MHTPSDSAPLADVPRAARRRLAQADFYEQGQRSARMGNTRSPGNEYSMPVFGEGHSWQAKAFARGFRDECERLGRTIESDIHRSQSELAAAYIKFLDSEIAKGR